jgi:hypothetical protein
MGFDRGQIESLTKQSSSIGLPETNHLKEKKKWFSLAGEAESRR